VIFLKLTIVLLGLIFGIWLQNKLDRLVRQKTEGFWFQTLLYCCATFVSASLIFGVMALGLSLGEDHTMTFSFWLLLTVASGLAFAVLRLSAIFLVAAINRLVGPGTRNQS